MLERRVDGWFFNGKSIAQIEENGITAGAVDITFNGKSLTQIEANRITAGAVDMTLTVMESLSDDSLLALYERWIAVATRRGLVIQVLEEDL